MASVIPSSHSDLLQKKAFANLATLMSNGTPQVTPVWFDFDGQHLRVNSAEGRVKDQNMRRNPNVAVAIADPENPYRYIQLRGKVVEITKDGADAHIDSLAKKYMGVDKYPMRQANEVRVIYKILPERANTMG